MAENNPSQVQGEGQYWNQKQSLNADAPANCRRQAHQACDRCRKRKVRCDSVAVSASNAPSPSSTHTQAHLTRNRAVASQSSPCRRCSLLQLPCTFLLPVKARGPVKGSSRRAHKASARTDSASSPNAGTTLSDANYVSSEGSSQCAFINNRLYTRSRDGTIDDGTGDDGVSNSLYDGQTTSPSSIYTDTQGSLSTGANDLLGHAFSLHKYPTDALCDRSLFVTILEDYVELLYPSIPIFHRPSFQRDLSEGRDLSDNDFLGLTIALCAVLISTMPRKFQEYKTARTPLQFQTRTEMVHRCREMITSLQDSNHYDVISLNKWAIPYLLSVAYFQMGQHNRARMLEVEAIQLARLLKLHNPLSHVGLSCIETQLRKKAFWLMFYTFVHSKMMRKERLAFIDESTLQTTTLHKLLPVEVDDEMILVDRILPQPQGSLSLAKAFNLHSLTFWATIMPIKPPGSVEEPPSAIYALSTSPASRIAELTQRLEELKYVLDGVAPQLRPWRIASADEPNLEQPLGGTGTELKVIQLESLRADLHVTHLWLQSIIVEDIATLKKSLPGAAPDADESRTLWTERQDICHRMLHVLHGISISRLEPNGNHLTHKIRDVAVTLLGSPFGSTHPITKRANEYLKEFIDILSILDASDTMSTVNMQTWIVVES